VPVVPVAIDGAYSVLPRGRKFPRLFRKVKVTFMKAIYPAESDSYETITEKVRTALAGVLEKYGDAAGAAESTRS
jgi:1-acyl-sn-glycerol-3-phosphate acyltransferase